jgi:toxin-antitoxin system PIN domain toxin
MTYLPDVNVWLALAVAEHMHHSPARRWFESAGNDMIAFCRVTEMGLLRLLTNSRVLGADALTPARAWNVQDGFYKNSRIVFAAEPRGIETSWRALTATRSSGVNFWTDAYLAAFASAAGDAVVTFDKGFRAYPKAEAILLGSSG